MSIDATFEGTIRSSDATGVTINPPGNSYEIRLALDEGTGSIAPGTRLSGVARARALRVHHASAGGAFIEPVMGQPRIVAGRVLANDGSGSVVVRSAIPIVVEVEDPADLEDPEDLKDPYDPDAVCLSWSAYDAGNGSGTRTF